MKVYKYSEEVRIKRRKYQKNRIKAMTPEAKKAFYRKNYNYTKRKAESKQKHIKNAITFLESNGYVVI